MTEEGKLDHRARKRIKEVKKKARPGKENGGTRMIYNLLYPLLCRAVEQRVVTREPSSSFSLSRVSFPFNDRARQVRE